VANGGVGRGGEQNGLYRHPFEG